MWLQSIQQSRGAQSYSPRRIGDTGTGCCSYLKVRKKRFLYYCNVAQRTCFYFVLASLLFTIGGVFEGEAGFGLGQLVEVVEANDVGRLEVTLGVLVPLPAAADFVVQLGGGERSQEGRVGRGDADAAV